ncbi:MAG: ribokinase, partial [Verrucomicrobiales bacterium]|nr:ribokinase [Verrucomicrobiales bacterium]
MSESESTPATRVIVAGSLNIDYVARVGRLPAPGETVAASELLTHFGGKGANQAVAAARQDIEVSLIGSLGDDEMALAYKKRLENEGIDVELVRVQPGIRTGSALIAVDDEGENTIIVSAGANAVTSPEEIGQAEEAIQQADAFLAQFEIPVSSVVEAARAANLADVAVIINPSPSRPTFPWAEIQADYVIVNEGEAIELLDFLPGSPNDTPMVVQQLDELNISTLIITRGSDPTLVFPENARGFEVPTLPVLPIDSVGAG